ncbi:hypothetical protein BBK82_00275 [Lentzea guizhouensis]|uniref:Galactan 5-O-arabinofuranosyltransferase n=1 Tax=Lentzea guizhouensis TaxID=1586287 RepID=A0A1B2HAK7_9PSEU|nr:hypothetical protein [Lentzea guizhouensis]ANZ34746.1 hypothetical protein BBK82_00275 [Lentzea guizhouensis]
MLSVELAPSGLRDLVVVDPVWPRKRRRWLLIAGEVGISLGAAALLVLWARGVEVDPLDRVGQVSGLAGLQLRFALIALAVLVVVVIAARTRYAHVVERFAAAAAAGLFSALVAGAVVVALRGTTYGLFASYGDAGVVTEWARSLVQTGEMPWSYPPGFIHAMAWYSELSGSTPEASLKVMQILGTAVFGPAAYLSWRLVLRPMWALVLGVVPSMVLIEPYKVYANLMLVVFVPVVLFLLQRLRKADHLTYRGIVARGIGAGAVIGVVFLVYSGWFVWSAPGVVVAALVVFPWRTGLWRGLTLVAVTTVTFVAVSWIHLSTIVSASGGMVDRYFYFDVYAEPTYIAMTRGDMPGALPGVWPPPGELGGVGVFTVIALVGVAAAIVVGRNRTAVILLTSLFAGAWLIRFYYASTMYERDAVQLYPRSSAELLYSMLLLCGFALYFGMERLEGVPKLRPWLGARSLRIAALAGMCVLIAMVGSSIGDRYMPRSDDSLGMLALASHLTQQPDGTCPAYAQSLGIGCGKTFEEYRALLPQLTHNAPRPGELPHRPR